MAKYYIKSTHCSLGREMRWLLVMADLPVPVGPTNIMGSSWVRYVVRKKV